MVTRLFRTILPMIVIIGFVGLAAVTGRALSQKSDDDKEAPTDESTLQGFEAEPQISAILFVNSKSCPCTREQCRIAEGVMKEILKECAGDVAFETVDYELQYERARPLLDKYDTSAFMIPVLVVLDSEHNVLWRCTDFSEPGRVAAQFQKLQGAANGSPNELPAETGSAARTDRLPAPGIVNSEKGDPMKS